MIIYFLYVKTHKITGLKYLGQTKQNPNTYLGSGKVWKKHLKEHGSDVDTVILFHSTDKTEVVRLGRFYSKLWNIVASDEWANIIVESGGGGVPGQNHYTKNPGYISKILGDNHPKRRPGYIAPDLGDRHPMRQKNVIKKFKGDNNYQTKPEFKYNSQIYSWKNKNTGECVTMTHLSFYRKFNLRSSNVVRVIKGQAKSVSGWELIKCPAA